MVTQKIVARHGLSKAEAKTRLAAEGPNELAHANRRTVSRIVLEVLREPLFSSAMIVWSLLQGALAFGLVAAIYMVALGQGLPVDDVRALSFLSLVIAIVALIFTNRSTDAPLLKAIRRPNQALAIVLPIVTPMLAATLLVPFVSNLFRFGPLHADDLLITIGAGGAVLVVLEFVKPLWRAAFGRRRDTAKLGSGVVPPAQLADRTS